MAYNASKAAVLAISRTAAVAYADDGIRVNSVSPGWVATDLLHEERAVMAAARDWRLRFSVGPRTLVKAAGTPRGASPAEISGAVAHLLSPASSFTTGTDLRVDGGALAW